MTLRQHWVLMMNDYPADILFGTEAEAQAECKHRAIEHEGKHPWHRTVVYWRVYDFPVRDLST